ncbi:MAG: hypothetical protein H6825_16255 [Planctomycetes bacterium]|nr:hypothetical protein [Planctomycetota bacterium]
MGLEIDPKQVEAIRRFLAGARRDPARMRVVLAITALLVGYFGLIMPFGSTLESLRAQKVLAAEKQAMATDVLMVLNQRHVYGPRLTAPADDVGWQAYILGLVQNSGLSLDTMEPIRRQALEPFVTLTVELVATADNYAQVLDFVRSVEVGSRPLRIEQITLQASSGGERLQIECALHALVLEGETADDAGATGDDG